jgi:hypothetical protein
MTGETIVPPTVGCTPRLPYREGNEIRMTRHGTLIHFAVHSIDRFPYVASSKPKQALNTNVKNNNRSGMALNAPDPC